MLMTRTNELTVTFRVLRSGFQPFLEDADDSDLSQYCSGKQPPAPGRADDQAWSGATARQIRHRRRQSCATNGAPLASSARLRRACVSEQGGNGPRQLVSPC